MTSFALAGVCRHPFGAEEAAAGGADDLSKVGEPLSTRLHGPPAEVALNVLGNVLKIRRQTWSHGAVREGAS